MLSEKEIDRRIGSNLKALRRDAGLSQQQVAALFGLTYQQMQKYEKGRSRVPARMLIKLQQLYGVPFDFFFAGTLPERSAPVSPRDSLTMRICRRVDGIEGRSLKRKIDRIIEILAA